MSSSATFTPEEVAEFLQPYLPYLDIKNEDKQTRLERWDSELHRFDIHIIVDEGEGGSGLAVWFDSTRVSMRRAESLEELRPPLEELAQANLKKLRSLLGFKAQE